jgi:hypothetical protein
MRIRGSVMDAEQIGVFWRVHTGNTESRRGGGASSAHGFAQVLAVEGGGPVPDWPA